MTPAGPHVRRLDHVQRGGSRTARRSRRPGADAGAGSADRARADARRPPQGGRASGRTRCERSRPASASRPSRRRASCASTRSASGDGPATCGIRAPSARASTPPRRRSGSTSSLTACLTSTRSSSAPGRTGSPRRSCWRGPGSRCASSRRADTVGGGARSAELTLPGFVHDVCSAIHPLAVASPFFRSLPLDEHGVEWIEPPAALAHPFDDGTAALLERSPEANGADARRGRRALRGSCSGRSSTMPSHCSETSSARCTCRSTRWRWPVSARAPHRRRRRSPGSRSAASGRAACSRASRPTRCCRSTARRRAAFGLMLGVLAHAVGWPLPRGGSQQIADALASYLRSLGGEIETGHRVASLAELGETRPVLLDVTPRGLLELAGDQLPGRYRRGLESYRYGPGVFKLDWALDGPIPVAGRGMRARRRRSTSAARSRRSRRRRRRRGETRSRSGRTCCSPSRASSTRRARPRDSTPRGRTATSRTARPST